MVGLNDDKNAIQNLIQNIVNTGEDIASIWNTMVRDKTDKASMHVENEIKALLFNVSIINSAVKNINKLDIVEMPLALLNVAKMYVINYDYPFGRALSGKDTITAVALSYKLLMMLHVIATISNDKNNNMFANTIRTVYLDRIDSNPLVADLEQRLMGEYFDADIMREVFRTSPVTEINSKENIISW